MADFFTASQVGGGQQIGGQMGMQRGPAQNFQQDWGAEDDYSNEPPLLEGASLQGGSGVVSSRGLPPLPALLFLASVISYRVPLSNAP